MPKILLHTCCGPCTTYTNEWLAENNFAVTGFFYNPNIQPQDEYEKRLAAMKSYADQVQLTVLYEAKDTTTQAKNCPQCYQVRLLKTAQIAKQQGFDCFSTTLLISPYQKHDLLKELAQKIGDEIGVKFYYNDFRVGFRKSQQMARDLKLYRQKYCGCLVSK